jgi:hypothetical protein
MTSVSVRTREISNNSGYFIAVASLGNQIFATPDTASIVVPWASTSLNASAVPGYGGGTAGAISAALIRASTVGSLFKDMGKTVVSSGTFFRKVQLVVPQGVQATGGSLNPLTAGTTSTFGVAGPSGATNFADFFTGYIRLGFEGQGTPAPVALFGR